MKYKVIVIKNLCLKSHGELKREWNCKVARVPEERLERSDCMPNPLGYYYFPDDKPIEKAFKILKDCMILAHKREIDRLEESLKKLMELTPPDKEEIFVPGVLF